MSWEHIAVFTPSSGFKTWPLFSWHFIHHAGVKQMVLLLEHFHYHHCHCWLKIHCYHPHICLHLNQNHCSHLISQLHLHLGLASV